MSISKGKGKYSTVTTRKDRPDCTPTEKIQYLSYRIHVRIFYMCTYITYTYYIYIAEVSLHSVDGSPVRGSEARWGRVKRLPDTRKQPLHPACLFSVSPLRIPSA